MHMLARTVEAHMRKEECEARNDIGSAVEVLGTILKLVAHLRSLQLCRADNCRCVCELGAT